MAKRWCFFLVVLLLSALLAADGSKAQRLQSPGASPQPVDGALGADSSVLFIENLGQFAEGARFQVRGGDRTTWLAEECDSALRGRTLLSPSACPKLLSLAPTIRVDPQHTTVQAGAVFTVEVKASDVVDLGSFDFTLTFSPTVLSVQSATLGSFLGSTGRTTGALGPLIDNATGSLRFGGFSFGAPAGPDGTGTLAMIAFRALNPGSSPAHFADVQFTDTGVPVQVQVPEPVHGSVTVLALTPTPTMTLPAGRLFLPVIWKAGG